MYLQQYHYQVFYIPGESNKAADALSRHPLPLGQASINSVNTKKPSSGITYPLTQTAGNYPFQRVAMDFMGPLPSSSSNHKYILVMMDTFSRYVELYPLSTPSQAFLANLIYHHFIPRHGLPDEFLSDNGPPFTSEFIVTLAGLVQLDLKFAPPYHQQANGIVERFNRNFASLDHLLCLSRSHRTTMGPSTSISGLRAQYKSFGYYQQYTILYMPRTTCTNTIGSSTNDSLLNQAVLMTVLWFPSPIFMLSLTSLATNPAACHHDIEYPFDPSSP